MTYAICTISNIPVCKNIFSKPWVNWIMGSNLDLQIEKKKVLVVQTRPRIQVTSVYRNQNTIH